MFTALLLVSLVSLIITGYCGIRWALVKVPATTELHIEELRNVYDKATPAELIREWEQMEKQGVDIASPYSYQRVADEKQDWGFNTVIAGLVTLLGLGGAVTLGLGRSSKAASTTGSV